MGGGEQEPEWGREGSGDVFLVPAPSLLATYLQLWEGLIQWRTDSPLLTNLLPCSLEVWGKAGMNARETIF